MSTPSVTCTGINTGGSACSWQMSGDITYNERPDYSKGYGNIWELIPMAKAYPLGSGRTLYTSNLIYITGNDNIAAGGIIMSDAHSQIVYCDANYKQVTTPVAQESNFNVSPDDRLVLGDTWSTFDYNFETMLPQYKVF